MRGFDLQAGLEARRAQQRYRARLTQQAGVGREAVVDGKRYLNFCSNDYLGLATEPAVVAAFQHAASQYGVGSGASHLVCGHSEPHHQLEQALASLCHRPRALLFSSGFMANQGVITALVGRGDAVFEDRLNHASLIDAGMASGARFKRYRHGDAAHAGEQVAASEARRKLVISDGVFSMDGDVAPIAALANLCAQQDAWLMIDDAHGIGVLGAHGEGSCAGLSSAQQPQVLVGTLGKAFGTFGAFVAGSEELIESLIQYARSYVYTTALPPAVAAATLVSVELVRTEAWRREKLYQHIQRFRDGAAAMGFQLMPSATPIQPLLIGEDALALKISEQLRDAGVLVSAIRPPTVPEGSARLRVTFSAAHTDDDVTQLLAALARSVPPKQDSDAHA